VFTAWEKGGVLREGTPSETLFEKGLDRFHRVRVEGNMAGGHAPAEGTFATFEGGAFDAQRLADPRSGPHLVHPNGKELVDAEPGVEPKEDQGLIPQREDAQDRADGVLLSGGEWRAGGPCSR